MTDVARPSTSRVERSGDAADPTDTADGPTDAAIASRRSFPLSSTPPLRDLWRHASRNRSTVVFATVLSLVNKVFDVLPEFLIGVAIGAVVNEGDSLVNKITGVEDRFEQAVYYRFQLGLIGFNSGAALLIAPAGRAILLIGR